MTGEGWLSLGLFEGLCPVTPQGGFDSVGCFMASWETPILVLVLVGLIVGGRAYRRRRRVANREPIHTSYKRWVKGEEASCSPGLGC